MQYIIGIDLGGTFIKLGLLNSRYQIKDRVVLDTTDFSGKGALIQGIADFIISFISEHNLQRKDILGVGLGLPGPIDSQGGCVRYLPNIPGWNNVPLRSILSEKIKLPVFIDNDANLMTLAEYKIGAARGSANAVCITLGTGVGGGLIIQGKLYRGSTFAAGEVGHMPINEDGPLCNCHGHACLERYIGNRRILSYAKEVFKNDISLERLSALAAKGNVKAKKVWQDIGKKTGIALTSVVNLLNPDCIVIGGGVANAGKILFDSIEDTIKSRAMATQAQHVKIAKAELGDDGGIIGAAILVKQKGLA